MRTIRIYTNGKSLFTLENFAGNAGISNVNGITLHSEVSQLKARAMHERGQLFYVHGMGDRKHLSGVNLSRKTKVEGFEIY